MTRAPRRRRRRGCGSPCRCPARPRTRRCRRARRGASPRPSRARSPRRARRRRRRGRTRRTGARPGPAPKPPRAHRGAARSGSAHPRAVSPDLVVNHTCRSAPPGEHGPAPEPGLVVSRLAQPHPEGGSVSYNADPERYDGRMLYRRSGRSGLDLPALSLGYWHNFGDDRPFEVQREISRRAFDLGITHHDLANNYGPPYGAAEINFGRLMREDFGPYRDELVISTKAGWDMWPGPYGQGGGSRKYLLASLDQSLAADGARLRRHLLQPPARCLDPARGDDGRARRSGADGQGALRRDLLLRRRAHPRGGGDPRRPRHPASDPPALLLDGQPLDRDRGPARRRRRVSGSG